jgi:hypothetical protein
MPRMVHIEFEGPPYPVIGCLSWVGLTSETGVSPHKGSTRIRGQIRGQFLILATPRPSQAIGHCPWKPWMNAAGVPVSESGDDCPREILVTSSSGRLRPTGWREWLGSRTPKGDAAWRVIPSSSAVSANRCPPTRIKSGPPSKTRKSFPDPFAGPLRLSAFLCGSSPRVFRLNRRCP